MTRRRSTGQRIRTLRRHAGLSQADLARACGVSPATLCDLEMGRTRSPGAALLLALARELGTDPETLMGAS